MLLSPPAEKFSHFLGFDNLVSFTETLVTGHRALAHIGHSSRQSVAFQEHGIWLSEQMSHKTPGNGPEDAQKMPRKCPSPQPT
jgi:hypothetical protein